MLPLGRMHKTPSGPFKAGTALNLDRETGQPRGARLAWPSAATCQVCVCAIRGLGVLHQRKTAGLPLIFQLNLSSFLHVTGKSPVLVFVYFEVKLNEYWDRALRKNKPCFISNCCHLAVEHINYNLPKDKYKNNINQTKAAKNSFMFSSVIFTVRRCKNNKQQQ